MKKDYYIYILASDRNGALYIGVTNNLARRIFEHKSHEIPGFSSKYKVDKLVYYEIVSDIESAIQREKRIKSWKREWKLKLIEDFNNNWEDLYNNII